VENINELRRTGIQGGELDDGSFVLNSSVFSIDHVAFLQVAHHFTLQLISQQSLQT